MASFIISMVLKPLASPNSSEASLAVWVMIKTLFSSFENNHLEYRDCYYTC